MELVILIVAPIIALLAVGVLSPTISRAVLRLVSIKAPKTLPPASAPPALPEPVAAPPPRQPTMFELAGILTIQSEDRMGDWTFVEWDGKEHNMASKDGTVDPKLLGLLIKDSTVNPRCGYCGSWSVRITQVVRRTPPPGAEDLGLCERKAFGTYCAKCGRRHEIAVDAPEPFQDCENLHDALKALAADNGKLSKKIRWDMLSEEYARLQPRTVRIAEDMNRLHAELYPRTDIDPYRGLPLAKLDDPPDNRAKAMPALTSTSTGCVD